jgi:hypothetical protein
MLLLHKIRITLSFVPFMMCVSEPIQWHQEYFLSTINHAKPLSQEPLWFYGNVNRREQTYRTASANG